MPKHCTRYSLETERLRLLALSVSELQSLLEDAGRLGADLGLVLAADAFAEPVMRAIRIKLEKMSGVPEALHPWLTYWLIVLRDERVAIGSIGFKGEPDDGGEVEIGYGIAASYWNRGLGTEAARALIAWGLGQPGCRAVWGDPLKTNVASNCLLAACGGRLVRETPDRNVWRVGRSD